MSEIEGDYELTKGTEIGGLLVIETLGTGSFGITYKAYDPVTDRTVAIKEYMPERYARRRADLAIVPISPKHRATFQKGLERFVREARTLANLTKHPNIVLVYNALTGINGTAYIVMEYLPGEELEDRILRTGALSQAQFWELFQQILSGTEAVHQVDLLHRDLKPSNIVIDQSDKAVLIDFGAAREVAVNDKTRIVTDGYSPPEQYQKDAKQGPATDIYALAATAYFMLGKQEVTSAQVRKGSASLADLHEITGGRVSREVADAIQWGLELEYEDRPQTIAEWRERLRAALEPQTSPVGDPDGPNRRMVLGLIAGGVTVLGAGAAYVFSAGEKSAAPTISSNVRKLVAGEMQTFGFVRDDPMARAAIVNGKPIIVGHSGERFEANRPEDGGGVVLADPKIRVAQLGWDGSTRQSYTGSPYKYAQAVAALPDGGLIIGGTTSRDYGFASSEAYLARLDDRLNLMWSRTYGSGSITDLLLKDDRIHFALEGVSVDGKAVLIRADLAGNQIGQPIELGTKSGDSVQRLIDGPAGTIGAAVLRFKAGGRNETIVMQMAIANSTNETTEYFVAADGLWLDQMGLYASQPYTLARIGEDFIVAGMVAHGYREAGPQPGLTGQQPFVARYSGKRQSAGEGNLKWRVVRPPEPGSKESYGVARALAVLPGGEDLPRLFAGEFIGVEGRSRICQLDDDGAIIAETAIGSVTQQFMLNDIAVSEEGAIAVGMTFENGRIQLAAVPLQWT